MRTIVHISDLHFGRVDHKRVVPLQAKIAQIAPDLVVISGDITQRAKVTEFKEAEEFIRALGRPVLAIPGNHDIPLFNIFARAITPFKRYMRFIDDDLSPFFKDKEIAVLGINSVRRDRPTSGKINERALKRAEELFADCDPDLVKIVVAHHPFDLIHGEVKLYRHIHTRVGRAKIAIRRLSRLGVDMFLSGHLHIANVSDTAANEKIAGYSGLMVHAGTAISTRSRGGIVSFNVIRIDRPTIVVERYVGESDTPNFSLLSAHTFKHGAHGWKKVP